MSNPSYLPYHSYCSHLLMISFSFLPSSEEGDGSDNIKKYPGARTVKKESK